MVSAEAVEDALTVLGRKAVFEGAKAAAPNARVARIAARKIMFEKKGF